jgi:hypothetical protein
MKRGTPRHPKVAHLRQLLKIGLAPAVGYLELLWHFTSEFAPQGDVGRFADERIEAALHWQGRAGRLVSAMVESGWLDHHPGCRLCVHDWGDHCDDAVRKRLSRAGLYFLSIAPKMTGHRQTSADNGSLPLPLPLPKPEPKPEPPDGRVRPSSADFSTEQGFDRIYAAHPNKAGKILAQQALTTAIGFDLDNQAATIAKIENAHQAWLPDFQRDGGKFCPQLHRWLTDQKYLDDPPAPVEEEYDWRKAAMG